MYRQVFCVALLVATPMLAMTTGSARGRVTNALGQPLSGAVVTVRNVQNGLTRQTTAVGGLYTIAQLPPGQYTIVVVAEDARWSSEITIENGVVTIRDVSLNGTRIQDEVTVQGNSVIFDRRTTIDAPRVNRLGTNVRGAVALVTTTPDAVPDRSPLSGGAPTSGFSIAGQGPRYNAVVIDGISSTDRGVGAVKLTVPQESVASYDVLRPPYSAEYGGAVGGVVNALTKSGTNQNEASVFWLFRNSVLSTRKPLAPRKTPFEQHQFGGSFGGAIRRDHLFVFAAMELLDTRDANVVTVSSAAIEAIRSKGFAVENGPIEFERQASSALLRFDWNLGESVAVRFRIDRSSDRNENQQPFGGQVALSAGGGLQGSSAAGQAGVLCMLSSTRYVETTVAISQESNDLQSLDEAGGVAVIIPGVARFGTRQTLPQLRETTGWDFAQLWSTHRSNTVYKGGINASAVRLKGRIPFFMHGQYQFTGLPDGTSALDAFRNDRPSLFVQAFGNAESTVRSANVSVFEESTIQFSSGWLRAGARLENYSMGKPTDRRITTVAPRLSASWAPRHWMRVFGAAGRSYGQDAMFALFTAGVSNGVQLRTITRTSRGGASPAEPWLLPGRRFPNEQSAGPSSAPQAIFRVGEYRQPRLDAARFGVAVQNQIVSAQVEGEIARGRYMLILRDLNPVIALPAIRPDPRFSNIYTYDSMGNTWYSAATTTLGFAMKSARVALAYTLADADDDFTDWRTEFQAQDPFRLDEERGASLSTPRHRLVISGDFEPFARDRGGRVFRDTYVGFFAEYALGRAYNQLAGFDRNQNGDALTDRPAGVGRNRGVLPNLFNVDLRIGKTVHVRGTRLELTIDAFNVLNRINVIEIQNVANQPGYGHQPLRVTDGRRIQLGARIRR